MCLCVCVCVCVSVCVYWGGDWAAALKIQCSHFLFLVPRKAGSGSWDKKEFYLK